MPETDLLAEIDERSQQESVQPNTVTVGRLFHLLAERKRFIVRLTLGAGVLAVAISMLLPKYYQATTTLMPPQPNRSLAS